MHQGSSWSVLLNVFYHMKHEYIKFTGGYLDRFRDIKPFMKCRVGCARARARGLPGQCN